MTRTQLLASSAVILAIVILTTWVFRSQYLISWDAANFAFALQKIDIAAHRPHPPGYLGYVFAGRALFPLFHDANAALIAWNVLMRAGAGILVLLLTMLATGGSVSSGIAATTIFLSSPLVWFYSANAEIYPSELFCALAATLAAAEAFRGRARGIYWMAVLLPLTVLFKISAAVLLMPAAIYTWVRAPLDARRRAGIVFAVLLAAAFGVFFAVQHDFPQLLWAQFTGATASSRLVNGTSHDFGRTLNRNIRYTLTDLLAAFGIVNGLAVVAWAVIDRRVPPRIDRWLVALVLGPWLAFLMLVHIGNPGYVLPLVPLGAVIIGSWYARLGTKMCVALLVLQGIVNLGQVAWLAPADLQASSYRDKTFLQRMESDLQPLTFPTRAAIRTSDRAIDQLLTVRSGCLSDPWVVVAGGGKPVDWRRASYYLPDDEAIWLETENQPISMGRSGERTDLTDQPTLIRSACGLIWISEVEESPTRPSGGRRLEGLGWIFPPGQGTASLKEVTWNALP